MTMIICGWKNENKKMRMIKCGQKNVNDKMRVIKSLWGEMSLRCFLTVLLVNKPGHIKVLRPREVQLFLFNHNTDPNIFTLAE